MKIKFAQKVSFKHPETGEETQGWSVQIIDSNEVPIYIEFNDEEKKQLLNTIASQITRFDNIFVSPNNLDKAALNLFFTPEPTEGTPEVADFNLDD